METKQKKTKLVISMLALGLLLWSASIVHGAQYLTVNGQDVTSITLELGQSRMVEIVSTDSTSYEAYVGFYMAPVIGDFSPLEIKPEAGKGAQVAKYSTPGFRGYHVMTGSGMIIPSPGVHFVFQFEAQQVGETDIKLYDETLKIELDSLHITVIPAPMGTAFIYQGRLLDDNNPTDGPYDFEFKLYDSPVSGNQLAGTIDINDLDVIDGYFTVQLDFNDPNVFNGDACWLDIGVRPGDGSSFTMLSPRQQLTPAPYAIYAENAGPDSDWMVSGDNMYSIPSGNVGIGTTSPESSLHIKSQQPEVRIEESDQGDKKWHIAGYNSGLVFAETGEGNAMYIEQGGNVGIRTTNPGAGLHLKGTDHPSSFMYLESSNNEDTGFRLYEGTSVKWHLFNEAGAGGLSLRDNAYSSVLFAEQGTGEVGIGTTAPEAKLHIRSSYPEVRLEESDQSDKKWSIAGYNSGLVFTETGEGHAMYIEQGGQVGIGTTSPGAKLEVDGDLKVTGAYKGNISSSSGSDGAPFPRPAYDSGWQEVSRGLSVPLQHNIGGDPNNYVVDMQFKAGVVGVNHALYGGDGTVDGTGAFWHGLTNTEIFVHREMNNGTAIEIRVRIWVYN
jgi:hypothetical protein